MGMALADHNFAPFNRGNEVPRRFNPATIKRMIEGPMPSTDGADECVVPPWLGGHLTVRAVNYMLKRAAINAGINPKFTGSATLMPATRLIERRPCR